MSDFARQTTADDECYVGCPVWACENWVGSLYSTSKRRKWLAEYSHVFNTVEGNSTFYAMPKLETVSRWAAEVATGFRFVLKFPRAISHDCRLSHADQETRLFLRALEVLQRADRLGPSFLQLPPSFSGSAFSVLEDYLRRLPRELPFAVEVRHPDYFGHADCDDRLNELLFELAMDRVIFDSRSLFSAPPSDAFEEASQVRKPNLPVRPIATGPRPIVRFVGRNRVEDNWPAIEAWIPLLAEWIERGKTPYFFTHSPDDRFAPAFARRFHADLRAMCPQIRPLPKLWEGEKLKRQRELF